VLWTFKQSAKAALGECGYRLLQPYFLRSAYSASQLQCKTKQLNMVSLDIDQTPSCRSARHVLFNEAIS